MIKAEFFKISHNHPRDKYMPGLDVYRAAAILLGLAWHFLQIDSHDPVLVSVISTGPWGGANPLFVISGFLLGGQIFSRIIGQKDISMRNFFIRRLLKTWPAYFVLILIVLLSAPFFSYHNLPSALQLLTFTQNFDMSNSFLSHTWSLAIEEHFYLILTAVSFLFFSRPSLKAVSIVFGLLFGAQLLLRAILWNKYLSGMPENALEIYFNKIYYQTYCRIDGLLFGVYLAYLSHKSPDIWKKILALSSELLPVGLLLCLLGFGLQINRTSLISTLLVYPLETLGLGIFMIYCLDTKSKVNAMKAEWIKITATLSYCLYLTHKPVFHLVDHFFQAKDLAMEAYLGWTFTISFLCTFLAAYLLHICVERPLLQFREKFKL